MKASESHMSTEPVQEPACNHTVPYVGLDVELDYSLHPRDRLEAIVVLLLLISPFTSDRILSPDQMQSLKCLLSKERNAFG